LPENLYRQTAKKHPRLQRVESDALKLPPGRAIDQINAALSTETSLKGFLPAAQNTLLAVSDEFMGILGVEAIKIAEYRSATAVDRQDVLEADRNLRRSLDSGKQSWRLALGGFTGGAAVAAFVAILLAPKSAPHAGYWWLSIAALGAVTLTLFVISYPRRKRKSSAKDQ
jgi:hypothetical protein